MVVALPLTFIAVPDGVAVHVEVLVVEVDETEPGLERVDGHDEEDSYDPALLGRVGVVAEVLVDLVARHEDGGPREHAGDALARRVLQERGAEAVRD